MRAQSIYDRSGNSYRYCRAIKEAEEVKERKAQDQKSDNFYRKIGVLKKKANRSEQKADSDGLDVIV